MFNPYQTHEVKIIDIIKETPNTRRFILAFKEKKIQKVFDFVPGQILEVSLPPYNEAPFAYCSSPLHHEYFEITIRAVGSLTNAMHKLKKGDTFGVRGPYGNGWPMQEIKNRNILMIAGGIGLIPFRPLIKYICENSEEFTKNIQLFYGAKSEDDLIFKKEYKKWCKNINLHITLDRGKPKKVAGLFCDIGLITTLFDKVKVFPKSLALVCGPPIMCKFVVRKLKALRFSDRDIYLSLERKMECAVGICEHCAVGSFYVCKDGPVFQWSEIKHIKDVI
ncbi:MAG: FAD/NAD(P)-binding protein [Patescibacteria group bacterium]